MPIHSELSSLLAESRAKSHSLVSGSSFASRLQKESQIYRPKDWWAEMAVGRTGSLPRHVATPHVLYDQLLQLFKGSVFICAGAAADKAASMPASVYRMRYRKSGEYRERVSRNHPCVRLLEQPHPRLTSFDMHYQNFGWLQICGDAYMHKQKNAFGIPVRLNPLSPQWVKVIPGELNFVDGYRVNSLYIGTKDYDVPVDEMLHFQKKSLDWSNTRRFYGLSTIIAAENTIQLEAEMLQRLRHKFSNLANPGLVFKTKRRLNEAQLKQNLDAIWMQHRLAEHEGKPMLVHDDMDLISGADGKTQELDYRGSLEDTLKITSAAFGVPLAIVGLTQDQSKANAEAQMSTFAHNKLNPMLMQYSQSLTNQLARDFEDDLVIEVGPFTVRDYKEIVNGAQALWRAGAITPNEIRDHLLNLPPLDQGGDTPVLPAGVQLATYGNDIGDGLRAAGGDEAAGVDPSYLANMWG